MAQFSFVFSICLHFIYLLLELVLLFFLSMLFSFFPLLFSYLLGITFAVPYKIASTFCFNLLIWWWITYSLALIFSANFQILLSFEFYICFWIAKLSDVYRFQISFSLTSYLSVFISLAVCICSLYFSCNVVLQFETWSVSFLQ